MAEMGSPECVSRSPAGNIGRRVRYIMGDVPTVSFI